MLATWRQSWGKKLILPKHWIEYIRCCLSHMSCKLSLLLCICILRFIPGQLGHQHWANSYKSLAPSWLILIWFDVILYFSAFLLKEENTPLQQSNIVNYHSFRSPLHCHPFNTSSIFPDIMWLCTSIEIFQNSTSWIFIVSKVTLTMSFHIGTVELFSSLAFKIQRYTEMIKQIHTCLSDWPQ